MSSFLAACSTSPDTKSVDRTEIYVWLYRLLLQRTRVNIQRANRKTSGDGHFRYYAYADRVTGCVFWRLVYVFKMIKKKNDIYTNTGYGVRDMYTYVTLRYVLSQDHSTWICKIYILCIFILWRGRCIYIYIYI